MESTKILKALRELSGLSVTELADKAKISRSYAYKIEGDTPLSPTIDIVKRWVAATRPHCETEEWLQLALKLILDEKAINEVEKQVIAPNQGTQAGNLIRGLLPMRFINTLIRR